MASTNTIYQSSGINNISMGTMGYGLDEAGITRLKSEFAGDFNRAKTATKGPKYEELLKAIRSNWSGVDCEAFLQKLDHEVGNIYYLYGQVLKVINQTLDEKEKAFLRFQQVNADAIINGPKKVSK